MTIASEFLESMREQRARLGIVARSRTPHLQTAKPPASPVEVRHVFEDLAPSLRETALRMAEGRMERIKVISSSRFEVLTDAELEREAAAAKIKKEAITLAVEKEPPAKTTRSRKPRKITEPEKISD